jgi:hypothetical protein
MDSNTSARFGKTADALHGARSERSNKNHAALCFKVPVEFRRWFKRQALQKDMTMTELLILAVESYLKPTSADSLNT